MHHLRISTALALTTLVSTPFAQGFNLDVGDNLILWPTPSSSYGAAAAQQGSWNAVSTPYDVLLEDLFGGITPVRVQSNTTSSFNYPFSPLTANDEAFIADAQAISSFNTMPTTWRFSWLEPGVYDVYTYAYDPEDSGAQTEVTLLGSAVGTQTVGGVWNGSPHVQGVTHSVHTIDADLGTIVLEVQGAGGIGGDPGSVNGFQLVRTGDSAIAHNYCASLPHSASGSGARMSVAGSASVAANDLVLRASPVPNTPGIFYYGQNQIQVPFGDGFRCVGGATFRLPFNMGSGNILQQDLDNTSPPQAIGQITAGSTWNFQAWFRDPMSSGASGFNLSDGFELTFLP